MARGGKNLTNTPKLKGAASQGSRPAGSSGLVPNGKYPTVLGTKKLPMTPGPLVPGGSGQTTVNSTPAKRGKS